MDYLSNELYHHGIKGQRWGIRRYQNLDGTLTAAGRERYGSDVSKVKESKLQRQNKRLLYNNRGHMSRETEEMKKFFKDVADNSDDRGIPAAKAAELGEKFIRNLSSTRLQSMGFDVNEKNVTYLSGQKWFRNSTLLSNTLATFGVAGVEYTSRDDVRSKKKFKNY